MDVTLKSLLKPDGNAFTPVPYAIAYSLVGDSGPLVVALQYKDYLWAFGCVFIPILCALLVIGAGWALWGLFGERLPTVLALALAVFAGCLVAQVVEIYIAQHVMGNLMHPEKPYLYQLSFVRGALLWWGLGVAAWYVLKRAERHASEVSRAELARDELRASTAEARLQALQAQVEPHFLFNTLAHVKWLYRRDPDNGRRMLDRFLDYLGAALPRVRQATTTLEQELELAHAYLDIQQLRIGGRLTFSIDVPQEIAHLRFPPLMLLTLVENAIKHGIAPQTEGGTIGIRAQVDENVLRIEVRDTGAGLREAAGRGIGLANVRARLAALFGASARLVIEPNMPRGVVAAIEIPR
jgi:signal transduction histidine kinase